MAARKPPETWFWSHDIKSGQIDSVLMPGMRLVRLSSYGTGTARRFAALVFKFKEPGPVRTYALDLDAAALAARVGDTGARPVGITVDAGADAAPRFSVVLEAGPGPLSRVHVDLEEAGVRALLDDHHAIADVATYVVAGVRKYAVILEDRDGPSWFFTGVAAQELDARLLELGAALVRVRAYTAGGRPLFAAVAEPSRVAGWAWYAELDGDGVARNLEGNSAYPFDLDATRGDRGVRFTVVMYRDR